ncbi:M23 family metallopeptidase [bacterium]|nr:M23 family metallopeptidase [bacterium]
MRVLFLALYICVPAFAAGGWDIWPSKVRQGEGFLLRGPKTEAPFEVAHAPAGQKPVFWSCGTKQCAVIAVPLDEKQGKKTLKLTSAAETQALSYRVVKGKFKVDKLKVSPKITRPSPEDQARAAEEKKEIDAAYALGGAQPLWTAAFARPTSGIVTSLFGNQRTYNGEVQSTHFGVDLRANETTPIHSTGPAKVLLAKNFFYAGNMVLLDHGGGVFTSYAHLSVLDVAAGQEIAQGAKLGMAGATGRVTGPHLHWSARLNGVPTDAMHLQKLFDRAYEVPALAKRPKKKG